MARRTSYGVLLAACLGLLAVSVASWNAAEPPGADRKVFKNSVIPLPDKPGPAPHGLMVTKAVLDHKKDKMDVLFSLAIPKEARAKLEDKVLKGQVLDPQDLTKDYSPRPEDVERLVKWLKDEGFEVTHTSPDKTSVYVRGTVEQIEKSLQVKMIRVAKNGLTYNAAQNAPSLPAEVGAGVQAVIGLQPFRQATRHTRIYRPVSPAATPATANAPPYLVKEVLKAYNADNLGVTGKGQKIAILIDTLPLDADTAHFWTRNNLPVTANRVEKIKLKDGPLPPVEGEESMDVQWSSGIASGAKVRVYACGSLAFVDLDLGLDRILADAMADAELRQVSISLGLGEQFLSPDGTPNGEVAIEHQKLLQLAALGVNVFVSSGDGGSNPDQFGQSGGDKDQTEWMASSPFAIGVGGTALHLDSTGAISSETGWVGSGGGVSKVFDRPAFQNQPGMPQGQKRLVPDVCLLAAPETGAYVRVNGADQQIGGTSLSAPVWAGFCALMNEARTKANKPTLPYLNPLIYPLKGSDSFRDITDGSNGGFDAGAGYDMVTGLGAPHLKNLISKLTQ
jgi:kumamolisin